MAGAPKEAVKKKSSDKTDYAAEMKAASKKGDKKAYYTAQRKRAEKTGDKAMLSKINSKRASAMTAANPSNFSGYQNMGLGYKDAKPKPMAKMSGGTVAQRAKATREKPKQVAKS